MTYLLQALYLLVVIVILLEVSKCTPENLQSIQPETRVLVQLK